MNNKEKLEIALEVAFESKDIDAWRWIVKNHEAKAEYLDTIEQSIKNSYAEDILLREMIARHPNSSEGTLKRIASKSEGSLLNVLCNINCPDSIIKKAAIIINRQKSKNYRKYSKFEDELNKRIKSKKIKDKLQELLIIADILD